MSIKVSNFVVVVGVLLAAGLWVGHSPAHAAAASDPVVAAAGDIACDPANANFNGGLGTATVCKQQAVANTIIGMAPQAVLTLGDTQYYCGGYQAFLQSYDLSWGQFKSITHPSVGNHEYLTSGGTDCDTTGKAAGYFQYFGAAAGSPSGGYYSFNLGSWHLIALNTQCSAAGGCGSTSPQGKWLVADLAANTQPCTLAYWHIPLFSSGGRANSNSKYFWTALYNAHADLVLDGHDHIYERFSPQTPSGASDPTNGIIQITAGTGGANHTSIATIAPNSVVRDTTTFGALELVLHPGSYAWQFLPSSGGTFTDSGSAACHSAAASDTQSPTAPTLSSTSVTTTSVGLSWTASTDNVGVAGYYVYRSDQTSPIATVSGTTTTYTDATVSASTSYTYTVKAFDAAGNVSPASNAVTVTTPASADTTPPTAPSNLTASSITDTGLTLSWTASTDNVGVDHYTVTRNNVVVASSIPATTTSFNDTGLAPSTSYTYVVTAYDAAGNSTPSAPYMTTTLADTSPPTQPGTPQPSSLTATSVTLNWTASTDDVGVASYTVSRTTPGSLLTTTATTTTNAYTDTGLTPGTQYTYTVTAYDAAGNQSPASSPTTITTPTSNPITLVQQTTGALASFGTAFTVPISSTTGDTLVAAIAIKTGGSVSVSSVVDSTGTTWTKGPVGFLSGYNTRIEFWYRTGAPAVSGVTITLSGSNIAATNISEWSGIAASGALDAQAGAGNASSTTAQTPPLTTTNASDLVIGAVNWYGSATSTLTSSGYAPLNNFGVSTSVNGRAAYLTPGATGTYRASWTLSNTHPSGGAILALKHA